MTVTVSHTLNESLGEVTVFEPGHPSEELPGLHVHACAHLRFIPKPSIRISKVGLRDRIFKKLPDDSSRAIAPRKPKKCYQLYFMKYVQRKGG